jgi:hypothetical protein
LMETLRRRSGWPLLRWGSGDNWRLTRAGLTFRHEQFG